MRVLVTGGGGFLGGAIIKQLLSLGYHVRSVGRKPQDHLQALGVETIVGDLSDKEVVYQACQGVDGIFHVAAKAGIWGRYDDFYRSNVQVTLNILEAMHQLEIRYLVYTSTPSVVSSREDIELGDESLSYSKNYLCHYARTKAMAEKAVLDSNMQGRLHTIALRPHLIWGQGDPHLVPNLIKNAHRLRMVGDGRNIVDLTHVDNAAYAHILAMDAIINNRGLGEVFFVSDDDPLLLWNWINCLLSKTGKPIIDKIISFEVAYALGYFLEKIYPESSYNLPPMTRFLACQLGKSHFFNISKAKNILYYRPIVESKKVFELYITSGF